MRKFPAAVLLACFLFAGCASAEDAKPGFVKRTMRSLKFWDREKKEPGASVRVGALLLTMTTQPSPVKLAENRRVQVTLVLSNVSRKAVSLEFPTTQRIDAVLRDSGGKTLLKWSEDQVFAQEQGLLQINPGERAEYTVQIATRDMTAGREFSVDAFFPQYPELLVRQVIVPEP